MAILKLKDKEPFRIYTSGREVRITNTNGVITVDSDAYNENFNTNK